MILEPMERDVSHDQARVDAVVARGPGGAFAVAGLAVGIVLVTVVSHLAHGGH
mgnify:CR=1 FL=1